jgi:HAD superfamily hydrolase (TIGR01509 family)
MAFENIIFIFFSYSCNSPQKMVYYSQRPPPRGRTEIFMKIQGAIFDMDGTLVDSLSFWDFFWRDMGERYFGDPTFRMDATHFDTHVRTMIFSRAISYIHGYLKVPCSAEEFDDFAASYVQRFYSTVAKAKAGAHELLSALRDRGVGICLASATDRRYLNIALESCGLAEFFTPETVISCSDVGVGKERPDVFLAALEVLGTPLDATAVFEDSALALKTAKSAGFITVGVYDKLHTPTNSLCEWSDIYLGEGTTLADALTQMELPRARGVV